jgi:uncharacterized protein (TIRG00374 family)
MFPDPPTPVNPSNFRPRRFTAQRLWNWMRLVVGLIGLIIITYYVSEEDSLLETILGVDLLLVFFALSLNLFATFVKAMRWWLVIKASNIDISLQRLFGTYLVGSFFTQFMPGSSIGGDAMRMMEMGADSGRMLMSVSSVLVERAIGLITIFVSASLILILLPTEGLTPEVYFFVHAITVVGVTGLIILRFGWFIDRIDRILTRIKLGKVAAKLKTLSEALQGQLGHGRMLLNMVMLSFVANACTMSAAYLGLLAVDAVVPYFSFIPLIALTVAIEVIPISPGSLGLREAAYVAFLTGILGVTESQSLTTALIVRGIGFTIGALGGFVFIARALESNSKSRQTSGVTRS